MPHLIMRVNSNFNINSHPQLTQLASIGNVILICHVPIENYQSLKADPSISYLKIDKWLKQYFKR